MRNVSHNFYNGDTQITNGTVSFGGNDTLYFEFTIADDKINGSCYNADKTKNAEFTDVDISGYTVGGFKIQNHHDSIVQYVQNIIITRPTEIFTLRNIIYDKVQGSVTGEIVSFIENVEALRAVAMYDATGALLDVKLYNLSPDGKTANFTLTNETQSTPVEISLFILSGLETLIPYQEKLTYNLSNN